MPTPGEWKTVQARILHYAEEVGWTYVPRSEAEALRGFDASADTPEQRAQGSSLFFVDLLDSKVRELNPRYLTPPEDLIRNLAGMRMDITGNRDFLRLLRNDGKIYVPDEGRELNLQLIDYSDDQKPMPERRNAYQVTDEFYVHNGRYGTRQDIVFLINGIPVLSVECKNATKEEALALGVDQIRRYHEETPEAMVPEMLFVVTESLGFAYGVTWNTTRRGIFSWKHDDLGDLESKVKSFCSPKNVLQYLQNYILFAEKDDQLQKYVLRQHQIEAVEMVLARAFDKSRHRGLVWHTQGSGKTYTIIKAAELLFRAPCAEKPTILLMIDRNDLEDQLLRNLSSVGLANVAHADSMSELYRLLRDDYRGVIVTMIHKFRRIPINTNLRANIFVLVDEAHRTTGGDLGNYLMAALPNATFIGFTGTPIDKTAYGRGTFKTFGCDDDKGYLHKYSIAESIEDGTTLPLFYSLAPNDLRVPHDLMESEFLSLAEAEGVADIEELNRILDRAVNLKAFLKGRERVSQVARFVAQHFRENVEPLGYKAFLVGVDREACVLYKEALDAHLPADYSAIIFTGNNNDPANLKRWHVDEQREKQLKKDFARYGRTPQILIVTEKLLTGFDAPILYTMYLDKPMRDHTLLQAIARVNRPYENEQEDMVKPHGLVLDFVGLFDKLEKALAFDSDMVSGVVKDLGLLKHLFRSKMANRVPLYTELIAGSFDDKDVDALIDYFRDKARRKEFFKDYRELEMLYEIISPDSFLGPFMDDYRTVSAIYAVVRNAYSKRVFVDRAFQRKTDELVQKSIGLDALTWGGQSVALDATTIEVIKKQRSGDGTKVINLVKSIQKAAEEDSEDPFLVAMADRAMLVEERFEDRQTNAEEALLELFRAVERDQARRKEQAEKGLDGIAYFVLCRLKEEDIAGPELVTEKIRDALREFANWRRSIAERRELRKKITLAIYSMEDDLDRVTAVTDDLLSVLLRTGGMRPDSPEN